ncbi:MAG: hypothetical protein MR434_01660 [Ruminococcus sp.]|nr:hypothetical protein [Ruminococcus sp.]
MKKERKINKSTIGSTICIVVALFCMGVGFADKYKQKAQFKQASENAVRYISEKYGFDAEILGMTNDRYRWSFSKYSDEMELKMKYDDREFYVFAGRTKESSDCWDDYQSEEICSAAEKLLNENLPEGKILSLKLCDNDVYYYNLIKTYYDGTNLDEVLESCKGHIEMVLADTDLSDCEIADWFVEKEIFVRMTSFDTRERMEEFADRFDKNSTPQFNYTDYQKYAPYITDCLEIVDGEVTRLDIEMQKTNEFEYAYFPIEWRTFSRNCRDVQAVPLDYDQLSKSFGYYDEQYCLSKPVSRQYSFDSSYGDVWIYYPLEKLKDYDLDKIGVAWYSCGGFSNNRDISRAEICGDYAVFHLPFGEDYFMLVDNSGQEEYIPGWKKEN